MGQRISARVYTRAQVALEGQRRDLPIHPYAAYVGRPSVRRRAQLHRRRPLFGLGDARLEEELGAMRVVDADHLACDRFCRLDAGQVLAG
eukprot:scaffold5115_cov113-Isochrysis_galbana.AAC.6